MTREEAVALLERYSNYDGMGIPNLAGCKEAMRVAVDELKKAYPELTESEDERMMREFNDWLCEEIECLTNDLRDEKDRRTLNMLCYVLTKVKDWLEKQKEHKPSGETNVEPDSKIPREEYLYHLLANHIITFTDYTYLLAKKPFDYECANIPQKDYTPVEQKPADLSEMMVHKEPYIAPVPTPMVADGQKPEWSEEDEKKITFLERLIRYNVPDGQYGWVDGHKGGFVTKLEAISMLKSLRPQPKKELSIEKAIKWLDDTFIFLDNSSGRGRDCEITTHDFDSLEEMYDSFRKAVIIDSEPHWKPSEEQMKALNECGECKRCIKRLYEDLQKRYGTC